MTRDQQVQPERLASDVSVLASITGSTPLDKAAAAAQAVSFGRYTITRQIGRGGFGQVFLAVESSTWEPCAIKTLNRKRRSDTSAVQRFEREIRIGRELQHANILPVIDDGEIDGVRYFATPFVEGMDLLHMLGKKPMAVSNAVKIAREVAEAVAIAHKHGYLHRDIKPANILIDAKSGRPFVADFGLAKQVSDPAFHTETLAVVGTQAYMPPEQADPHLGDVSPAVDIYSIGVTLYQMLTGRTPFPRPDKTGRDILLQIAWDRPVPPSKLNPQVPAELDRLCMICLEKHPFDRYGTADELAQDLSRIANSKPIQARLPTTRTRAWRRCRRQPILATVVLGLVLLCAVGGMAAWYFAGEAFRTGSELAGVGPRLKDAESGRDAAQAESVTARRAELSARSAERSQTYVADMREAAMRWGRGEHERLRKLLEKYEGADAQDIRNLEWHYWRSKLAMLPKEFEVEYSIEAVALSPRGQRVAAVGQHQVTVLEIASGSRILQGDIAQLTHLDPNISPAEGQAAVFDRSGQFFAATCVSGSRLDRVGHLKVWDLEANREILSISDSDIGGRSVAFSPDSQSVLVTGTRTAWRAWSIPSGKAQGVGLSDPAVGAHRDASAAHYLRFVDDTTLVLSTDTSHVWTWPAARDSSATQGIGYVVGGWPTRIRDRLGVVQGGAFLRELNEQARTEIVPPERTMELPCVTTPAFAASSQWVAIQCENGKLLLWRLDEGARPIGLPVTLQPGTWATASVAVEDQSVASSADKHLTVWITDELTHALTVRAVRPEDVGTFGFTSPSGRLLAVPDFKAQVIRFTAPQDESEWSVAPLGIGTPLGCTFSPDERYVVVRIANYAPALPRPRKDPNRESRVELWDLRERRLIASLPLTENLSVAFDQQGTTAWLAAGQTTVRAVRLSDGSAETVEAPFRVDAMSVGHSGRLLVATGEHTGVFDIDSRKWLWTRPLQGVWAVMNPAEQYVVIRSTTNKGRLSALDCSTGTPWPTLFDSDSYPRVVLSNDERRVFALDKGRVRLHSLDANPGTLLFEIEDTVVPEYDNEDGPFVRAIEGQLVPPPSTP